MIPSPLPPWRRPRPWWTPCPSGGSTRRGWCWQATCWRLPFLPSFWGAAWLTASPPLSAGQRLTGSNQFFRTAVCAAAAAGLALMLVRSGVGNSVEAVTIGTLMLLVPGISLTNAMREIMGGDVISGVNRMAEVILVATAIALGSALPMLVARGL